MIKYFLLFFLFVAVGCEESSPPLSEEQIKQEMEVKYQKIEGVITDVRYIDGDFVEIRFEDNRIFLLIYVFSVQNDQGNMFYLNQFHTIYTENGCIRKVSTKDN